MNRDSKRRFHPRLDPLEGRQLLASGGSAGFDHLFLAVRGATSDVANEVPPPSGRIRNRMAMHADRNGAVARVKSPKSRGLQGHHKGNLRRQIPSQLLTTPAPAPVPAQVVVLAPTIAAVSTVAIPPMEQAVIDLTNQQRMLNGLAPLATSGKLVQAARIQAGNMAQLDQMSHVLAGVAQPDLLSRANAVGYGYAKLGENIAYNYAGAPEVVAGWMNSTGHKANILDPGFTEIGVAVAANSNGQLYYCQVFGTSAWTG